VRLWRGTSAGLLMAVPSVGIYMPVYDSLLATLAQPGAGGQGEAPWTAPYAPLIAGALSRSLACILCAPSSSRGQEYRYACGVPEETSTCLQRA